VPMQGHLQVVHAPLDKGVEINARDNQSVTALQIAAFSDHHKVVDVLRRTGARYGGMGRWGCQVLR
jgi:ankyrin repeat protein